MEEAILDALNKHFTLIVKDYLKSMVTLHFGLDTKVKMAPWCVRKNLQQNNSTADFSLREEK